MPGNPLQQKRRFIRPLIASALVPVFLVGLAVPVPALSFRSGLTTSTDLLDTLEVRPEATVPFEADGFERWIDADADGCDTAREVLIAASHPSMIVVEPPCTVAAGSWHSLYDNSFESDPAQLTVDHTVPLEEAWESGAWAWTAAQRRDFANDLRYAQTTLVTARSAIDAQKGSQDPAEWRPPYQGVHCKYADLWIFVKSRWNLSVDAAEYAALVQMLSDNCPVGTGVPERGLTPGRGSAAIIGQVGSAGTVFRLLRVEAYAADGSLGGRTTVDNDGTYELTGLAPGTYRIKFVGGTSGALDQWYSTEGPGAEATPVQVSSGGVIPGIDVGLEKPRLFTDIPPEHPHFSNITWAAASGYLAGYPDGTFRPETLVDRGSLASILYRYAGSPPVPDSAHTFTDVPAGSDDNDAIRWVAAWDIDTGYADGTFRPDQEITRRTLAVFLHRLADRPPVPADAHIYAPYSDIQPGVANYEELAWLASTFVIVGNPDGTFGPDQRIERGMMAHALNLYRFGFSFPVIGTVPSTAFADVPAGSQFAGEIADLHAKGVITGWTDGTFRPLDPVHRDAVAAFMYRLQGTPTTTLPAESPFADLRPDHPYYPHISWLSAQEITTGWPDETFRPIAPVNRDAMAAFLYRLAGSPSFTPPAQSPFADLTTANQFYKEITWLAQTGISTGWSDHTFRPYEPVNRDAMAAFLYRFDAKH